MRYTVELDPALFDKPEFTVADVDDVLGQAFRPKLGVTAGKGANQGPMRLPSFAASI